MAQKTFPEWAHLHREAAHWYSEKAAAYGRWESRCRPTGYGPRPAGRAAAQSMSHRPLSPATGSDAR